MSAKFRLRKGTFAVFASAHTGVVIPAGAIIEVPIALFDDVRLVDVVWNGNAMMMFVADILSRADAIEDASA